MMKKLSLFAVLLCIICTSAIAESGYYSVHDLPAVTSPRWEAQYEDHGRIISVDVDVTIPDVDIAPVITVRQMPPLTESVCSELEAWCEQAEKEDRVNRYSFRSNNYSTSVTYALPPSWGETRDSEFVAGAMGQNLFDLYEYDMDKAYADNNVLTVAEALAIMKDQAAAIFPEESLHLRTVYVNGQTFWKKSGEPICETGGYGLCLSQTFHGIPFMASIHEAFTQFAVGNEDVWLENRGILRGLVYDENAWSMNCIFYQEESVLHEDIQLLSFDAVKGEVEDLIHSGHVRWIDSVTLGYVQFDTANPDVQVLAPCWVVWCEYHPAGSVSERRSGVNSSVNLMYDSNSDYYRPLIINVQTGELIDPENASEGRCMWREDAQ